MPHDPQYDLVQSRVDQLKAITTRRNDLLREMYNLVRHRNSVGNILGPENSVQDGTDDVFQSFLSKLDLNTHGEEGLIANHIEALVYCPVTDAAPTSYGGTQAQSMETSASSPQQSREQSKEIDNSNVHSTRDGADAEEESDDDHDELDLLASADEECSKEDHDEAAPLKLPQLPPSSSTDVEMAATSDASGMAIDVPNPSSPAPSEAQHISADTNGKDTVTEIPVTTVNPQAIYRPSGSSSMPWLTPKSSIVIPAPLEPSISNDLYNVEQPPQPEARSTPNQSVTRYNIKTEYTLPPLQLLPPEFNRKKSTKRRKDRDRQDKSQKDDGLPMGINRWAAMLSANPLYKRVARSTKCLSTKEWSIAIAELRLIRAAERIEVLKGQARWGLRQVKKQRGVGGLLKTHWDYLMDEMKWMRIDFREERKWKYAMAYHLSTAVLEWHHLGTWEERIDKGVCVKWKPRQDEPVAEEPSHGMDVDIDEEEAMEPTFQPSHSLLGLGEYESDNDEMGSDDKQNTDVVNPLDTNTVINDALDGADAMKQQQASREESAVAPTQSFKMEEDENPLLPMSTPSGLDANPIDAAVKTRLKLTSNDPVLGSKSSSNSLADNDEKPAATKIKSSTFAPLRERLVYGDEDKLFIGPEDVESYQPSDSLNLDPSQPFDLASLFPDLQPLQMFDVAPPAAETKKKSSRTERDDPNKRIEETHYTKVYPIGQFMFSKPTLLGPLHPSKRWKDDHWQPMEDSAISPEAETSGYIKTLEESVSDLFDFKVKTSAPILPFQARDARKAKVDQYWSSNDDLLLKSLVDKYPGNWNLIAECFNGCRKTTPSDRRTANDCMDRWKTKWGMDLLTKDSHQVNSEDHTPSGLQASSSNLADLPMSSSTTGPSVTTRGLKRLASASVSSQVAPNIAAGSEPKKRRRHLLLQESIRKASRKRQEQQQKQLSNQRKTPGMHETHIQYTKLPKLSPGELSRLKAEKDAATQAEAQKARQRQEEMKNQQRQLNGIPIPPQIGQASAQQQQQQQQQQLAQAQQAQQQAQQAQQQQQQHQQQQAQQQQQQQQGQPGQAPQPISQQQMAQLQLLQQHAAQVGQAAANRVISGSARPGVNIARLSTPTAVGVAGSGPRLSTQQMMQLQQAHQRLAAGASQPPTLNGVTIPSTNGAVGNGMNAPVIPQFGNRDATASPATAASHLSATASGTAVANPPRSPHDQGAGLVGNQAALAGNGPSRQYNPGTQVPSAVEQFQSLYRMSILGHLHLPQSQNGAQAPLAPPPAGHQS